MFTWKYFCFIFKPESFDGMNGNYTGAVSLLIQLSVRKKTSQNRNLYYAFLRAL